VIVDDQEQNALFVSKPTLWTYFIPENHATHYVWVHISPGFILFCGRFLSTYV